MFKSTLLGVSGPKTDIFPKPEVSHKKVKIDVFALDIDFKLDLWIHITPLANFVPPPKKPKNKPEVHQETRKTHIFLLKKRKYMFFEFLGALPVWFWIFLGAKSVRGVMCTHNPSLKSISKPKTSIFTFSWLTSGLGKISFLGPETPKKVDLKTFHQKNNLISI